MDEAMKTSLEDRILLQFSNERKHMQPYEIDADRTDKEIAIANLVNLGYVVASENASSRYGRYVTVTLNTEGKKRQRELLQLMNRNFTDQCGDAGKGICRRLAPSVGRIVEDVIIAVVSGIICFWVGRVTAPHESDKTADDCKQEQTDNSALVFD